MSKAKVLVYAGTSVTREDVLERVPDAVVRPPARQGDLISDLGRYEPENVLLIDGTFRQSLSVWHKEVVFALASGVKVYGSSSMGALRAAELSDVGMIGCGRVFEWFWEGVLEDDSAVAVSYRADEAGECEDVTIPDVDLYATALKHPEWEIFLLEALKIPWWERTLKRVESMESVPEGFELSLVKRHDAILLLENFPSLTPITDFKPDARHFSVLFDVLHERERRVNIGDVEVPLSDIDACVALESPDRHETFYDASNRALALVLSDLMQVEVSPQEVEQTAARFLIRKGIDGPQSFEQWRQKNAMTRGEFERLMLQEARIYKLHRALVTQRQVRRRTQDVLDRLRLNGGFELWAQRAAIVDASESSPFDPESDTEHEWKEASMAARAPVDRNFDEWVREFGFMRHGELKLQLHKRRKESR